MPRSAVDGSMRAGRPRVADAGLDAAAQKRLVRALLEGRAFGVEAARVIMLETHISYVFLTGNFAYKIKKAVDLGFLDFTSVASRRFFCEQELKLNRRLAPELYVDLVPITGEVEAPLLGGTGPVLEYAVKMREFTQEALASQALARGEIKAPDIDALAATVAAFHRRVGIARLGSKFGTPDEVLRVALQNFAQIRPLIDTDAEKDAIDGIERWTLREHAARSASMLRRREEGFVRECHGDLHLGNIALIDGRMTIFDCIEFSEPMRWIDVMSEIAFTVMDLEDRGRPELAHRFLNAYLEITGDYDGLTVLRSYLVYRAMVRAKIARLRAAQLGAGDARAAALAEYEGYIELGRRYAQPPKPAIVITHGLSGSGKTTLSLALVELSGAVRIRTDVERKRALGEDLRKREKSAIDTGLYTLQATEKTYGTILGFARAAAAAGFIAIVDGAFLRRWQRDMFRKLAVELHVSFVVVSFVADEMTLRRRIELRQRIGSDASDADLAVLQHQLRRKEPLTPEELRYTCLYDAEAPLSEARSPTRWRAVLERLGQFDTSRGASPEASAPA